MLSVLDVQTLGESDMAMAIVDFTNNVDRQNDMEICELSARGDHFTSIYYVVHLFFTTEKFL